MKILKRAGEALALMIMTLAVFVGFAFGLSCVMPYIEKVPMPIIWIVLLGGMFLAIYFDISKDEKKAKQNYEQLYYKRKCKLLQYEIKQFKRAVETLEDKEIKEYLLTKLKENE